MNILFCVNSLGVFGGMECVTIVKANALADIPGNNVAICYTDKGNFPATIHPLSDKVQTYDLGTPYWCFTSARDMLCRFIPTVRRTRRALEQLIGQFRPDVVITTGAYEKFAIASISGKMLAKLAGHPVVKIREFHFASTYRRYIAHTAIQHIRARVIEVFEHHFLSRCFDKSYLLTRADLANFGNCPRYDYMYNPCRFSGDVPEGKERQKVILASGRLCQQKNLGELIQIWADVAPSAPGWKLRIVGSGSEERHLRSLVEQYRLEDSVELPGQSTDIPGEMLRASIYTMTSHYEGMPLVLIEALHHGLPVVTYRLPYGPDEIVRDGIDGYVVEYGNKDAFANRLTQLINNQPIRNKIGKDGKQRSKDFDTDRIAELWMHKYRSLIKDK